MRQQLLLLPALSLVLAIAPPSRAAAPEAAPAPAAAESTKVVGPPETAWKDMTTDQKAKFMKVVVTPKMRPVFQEFDAELFKKVDCATCHGKTAKARKFKMPTPDIHVLPSTPEAFKAALAKEPTWPKWTKFMGEKVEPTVAGLLGLPVFDPKKPEAGGFGCAGCHTLEKK
jgi:hypothetical protein